MRAAENTVGIGVVPTVFFRPNPPNGCSESFKENLLHALINVAIMYIINVLYTTTRDKLEETQQ